MRKIMTVIGLLWLTLCLHAQGDPHSLRLMGTAIEGPIDSVRQQLVANGFKEWGQSDDGEDLYFRGNFYGIRAKLILSHSVETRLVTSAYVSIGPYSTEAMLTKNTLQVTERAWRILPTRRHLFFPRRLRKY